MFCNYKIKYPLYKINNVIILGACDDRNINTCTDEVIEIINNSSEGYFENLLPKNILLNEKKIVSENLFDSVYIDKLYNMKYQIQRIMLKKPIYSLRKSIQKTERRKFNIFIRFIDFLVNYFVQYVISNYIYEILFLYSLPKDDDIDLWIPIIKQKINLSNSRPIFIISSENLNYLIDILKKEYSIQNYNYSSKQFN